LARIERSVRNDIQFSLSGIHARRAACPGFCTMVSVRVGMCLWCSGAEPNPVMPAKAGIQWPTPYRLPWIPALAGITGGAIGVT
jgi:hypothetical protein